MKMKGYVYFPRILSGRIVYGLCFFGQPFVLTGVFIHFPCPQFDVYADFLHDSVLLYALALNDTIKTGGNITSGRVVTRHMMNRSFEGDGNS
jgi:hypothetical protein